VIQILALPEGEMWHFILTDNGIGFDAELQDPFALFLKLHHSGENSGVGIGLAVCKRLVLAMGGRIWADSTPGKGSRFHFTLKAAA